MVEGSRDSDESADLAVLIVEWFLGGHRPIDKAITAWHELDPIHDGLAGFEEAKVVLANVLHDVRRNVVVVPFSQNFVRRRGFEDLTEPVTVGYVAEVAVFDEIDEAGQIVEDGGKVVLDFIRMKKSVILHGASES